MVPYGLPKARWGYRMGKGVIDDLLHKDGFLCPVGGGLMGELTDAYAAELGITREEQDVFAADCHNKVEAAVDAGKFEEEIVPIEVPGRKGAVTIFKDEEIYRKGATPESLAKLPAVFTKGGTVTAGNACALCDAAAAQVIMNEEKSQDHGAETHGTNPRIFLCGV